MARHLVLSLLILMTCGLVGCTDRGDDGTEGAAAPSTTTSPRPGGNLTIALQADGTSLDPHKVTDAASMRLIENLYSTLLRYAPAYGELEPDLAERYEVSQDSKTYSFSLRPNARFHSGKAVTSEDVRYSIERIRSSQVRAEQFAAVDRIETPDSQTVLIHLREPLAPFLTFLAYPMNAIVERAVVEASGGSIDQADAGSGPFKLVEWKKDNRLVMQRHDGYHVPERPYLDRVTFRPISDETARTTALRNGEVDLVLDVAAKDVQLVERAEGVKVESVPGTFWEYLGMNTTRKPLDDVRVRQAIAWALDRSAINKVVKFGRATVLDGAHIPKSHWAHADLHVYPARDVEKARQLLADAGHGGGLKLSLKAGSAFPYQVAAGQVIKQQLKDIGIEVELQSQESSVFFDALGRKDFDLTVVGWVGFVDPDEWTYNLFHTGAKWNQQGYANPQVDAWLQQARVTLDRDQRKQLYRQVLETITAHAPMAFLYLNDQIAARQEPVQGFIVHPTASTIFLRDTWLNRQ